jgi:hypothetical protein
MPCIVFRQKDYAQGIKERIIATLANAEKKAKRSDARAQVVIHICNVVWDAQ